MNIKLVLRRPHESEKTRERSLVESLSDTLTPTQLEQYEKKLDRKSKGVQTSVQVFPTGVLQPWIMGAKKF